MALAAHRLSDKKWKELCSGDLYPTSIMKIHLHIQLFSIIAVGLAVETKGQGLDLFEAAI